MENNIYFDHVDRYNEKGFVESLPCLNIERIGHGCAGYYKNDGKMVRKEQNEFSCFIKYIIQVLMVLGGSSHSGRGHYTMEMLTIGDSRWRTLEKILPYFPGVVTINNDIYIGGTPLPSRDTEAKGETEPSWRQDTGPFQLFKWNKQSQTLTELLPGL